MNTKIKFRKACSSLLIGVIVLIILAVFAPQQIGVASTATTATTNNPGVDGETPIYPANGKHDYIGDARTDGAWSLWNLILSIEGVLLIVAMTAGVIMKKKCNRPLMLLVALIPTVLAIIIFIFTQDMTKIMVYTDFRTPIHAILFACTLFAYIFLLKKENDEDEDNKVELAAAHT